MNDISGISLAKILKLLGPSSSALPRSDHLTLDTLLFIDLSAVIDHRDIVDVLTAPLLHFT